MSELLDFCGPKFPSPIRVTNTRAAFTDGALVRGALDVLPRGKHICVGVDVGCGGLSGSESVPGAALVLKSSDVLVVIQSLRLTVVDAPRLEL